MITASSLTLAAGELGVTERHLIQLVAAVDEQLTLLSDTTADTSTWWSGARADDFRSGNALLVGATRPVVPAASGAIEGIGRLRQLAVELAAELRAVDASIDVTAERLRRVRGESADPAIGPSEAELVSLLARHGRQRDDIRARWMSGAAASARATWATVESIPPMSIVELGTASALLARVLGFGTSGLNVDDPAEVGEWWAALPPATRDTLLDAAPAVLGNLDGIPIDVRVDANGRAMQAALDAATPGSDDWKRLQQFATADGGRIDPTRQFLVFDLDGDGRIAEVFGDLDAAEHIAVMVPGMGSTLDGFSDLSNRGRRLHAAGGRATAVIAWTGYDTPHAPGLTPDVFEVTSDRQAVVGGELLHRFVDGLQVQTDGSLTLIGHSYGSLTVGKALHDGASVDRVVFMGSPGVGADHVGEFPPGAADQFFASEIKGDIVANLEHFGDNPTDPDFGAFVFDSGDGDGLSPVSRHGEYYDEGIAIDNLATIVTGGEPSRGRTDVVEYVTEPLEDLDQAVNDSIDRIQEIDIPLIDDRFIDTPIDVAQEVEQTIVQGGEIILEEVGHFGQDAVEWGIEQVGGWFG